MEHYKDVHNSEAGSEYTCIFDDNQRTWNDAKTNCISKHSTLVQICDSETNDDVSTMLTPEDEEGEIGFSIDPLWIWSDTEEINSTKLCCNSGEKWSLDQ